MARQKQQTEEQQNDKGLEEQTLEQQDREEKEERPQRLSRRECAQRVVAEVDGDTTITELGVKADQLYRAGRDADTEPDTDTAEWHVQKVLETLQGVGLVELSWECVVHPKVARLGLPDKQ